nr:uncharacterized protein CI109_005426 [Kwoniella shandongensis]KAA5526302.1 hypothetical protein CI109_005426 [Kwoniella shandongensis]
MSNKSSDATSHSSPSQSSTTSSSPSTSLTSSSKSPISTTGKFKLHEGNYGHFLEAFHPRSKYSTYLQSTFSPDNKDIAKGIADIEGGKVQEYEITLDSRLASQLTNQETRLKGKVKDAKTAKAKEEVVNEYITKTSTNREAWQKKEWGSISAGPTTDTPPSSFSRSSNSLTGTTTKFKLCRGNYGHFIEAFHPSSTYSAYLQSTFSPDNKDIVKGIKDIDRGRTGEYEITLDSEVASQISKQETKLKAKVKDAKEETARTKVIDEYMTRSQTNLQAWQKKDWGSIACTTTASDQEKKSRKPVSRRPPEWSMPYSSQSKSQKSTKPPPSETEGWKRPEYGQYTKEDFDLAYSTVKSGALSELTPEQNYQVKDMLRSQHRFGRQGVKPVDLDMVDKMTKWEWPSMKSHTRRLAERFPAAMSHYSDTKRSAATAA